VADDKDEDKFECLVDGKQLSNCVLSIKSDTFKVYRKSNEIYIIDGKSKFKIKVQEASIFTMPVVLKQDECYEYKVNSLEFAKLTEKIVDTAGDAHIVVNTPVIPSLFLEFSDNKISLTNVSPIRTSIVDLNSTVNNDHEATIAVSHRDFKYIRDTIKKKTLPDTIIIQIGKEKNVLIIKLNDMAIYLRLLAIKKPKIEAMEKQIRPISVLLSKKDIVELIQKALIIEKTSTDVKKIKTNVVFGNNLFSINVNCDISSYQGEITATCSNTEDKNFIINGTLFYDCIVLIDDDNIIINTPNAECGAWFISGEKDKSIRFYFATSIKDRFTSA
jgi:hypothetical protein